MIIQLLHPGRQYDIRPQHNNRQYQFINENCGILYWSSLDAHRRKYIYTMGDCIHPDGRLLRNQPIVFWGEWEAHSVFRLIQNNGQAEDRPRHIHQPFISREREGKQNTDPFVFGEPFLYSNCLQSLRTMRDVPNGSLILFGSEVSRDGERSFVLDTVFVVETSIQINRKNLPEIRAKTPTVFHDTVLRKIPCNRIYRLYFSRMHSDQNASCFSYFPCKLYERDQFMLRPSIPIDKFNLKKPGSGQGIHKIQRDSQKYWEELKDYLRSSGYCLGVKVFMPPRIHIKDACEELSK